MLLEQKLRDYLFYERIQLLSDYTTVVVSILQPFKAWQLANSISRRGFTFLTALSVKSLEASNII